MRPQKRLELAQCRHMDCEVVLADAALLDSCDVSATVATNANNVVACRCIATYVSHRAWGIEWEA